MFDQEADLKQDLVRLIDASNNVAVVTDLEQRIPYMYILFRLLLWKEIHGCD